MTDLLTRRPTDPIELFAQLSIQFIQRLFEARGNTSNFFGSLYYTKGVIGEGGIDEANNLVGRAAYLYAPNPDTKIHFGVSGTRVFNFSEAATVRTPAVAGAFPGLQAASAAQFNLRDRPEIRVDGTRLVSTGLLNVEDGFAAGPEFGFNWKNLYLQSEYYFYELDRKQPNTAPATALLDTNADFKGWYVQGSWIVTGETKRYDIKNASFGAPRPASPLGMDGSFGAIELAARYSTVDLNDGGTGGVCAGNATQTAPTATSACIRGGEQDIITLGINWYPNRNVRFMLNYLFIDTDRQAYPNNSAAGLSGGPNAEIGQDVDVLALRSQFNF
ncbi:MAG: porin [bacterium]|nr:porin [bacterium]